MNYTNLIMDEERALYAVSDSTIKNCRFDGPADGESALKESHDIKVLDSYFNLRYPLWHVTNAEIRNCEFTTNCRAALWYDKNISISGCHLNGIKALRECDGVTLRDSTANSPEFFWKCHNLMLENVIVEESEYPFFEVESGNISRLKLKGKYSFQYCSRIEINNSVFNTKDAFWHSKNVTVRDSIIDGEYLGWYSENLTLINCRITGTQPFCYCKNLVLENCTMEKCDLAFERSTVHAKVNGEIDSVKNPIGGIIDADCIGEVIMEDSVVGSSKTEIIARNKNKL